MAHKIAFDTSELRALAADMSAIPDRMQRHVVPVVERGANNIKREITRNFEDSTHFKRPIAHTVHYKLRQGAAGDGRAAVEAEIGPMSRSEGSSDGSALAHFAIHGSPRGGGGTVADPVVALDNEAPNFEKYLTELAEDLLR